MIVDPRTGRQHVLAVLQALLVTLLWSTSWILVKIGLDDLDLDPLSLAGMRYALAAAILLPFGSRAVRAANRAEPMSRRLLACLAAAAISSHLGRGLARDATARLGGAVGLTSVSMAW